MKKLVSALTLATVALSLGAAQKAHADSNTAPTINGETAILTQGQSFNPLNLVTAYDNEDGDLTNKINVVYSTVNINQVGMYSVSYSVTDSAGATTNKNLSVVVKPGEVVDKGTLPTITATDVIVRQGETFNPLDSVSAYDKEDGDLTSEIQVISNTVDTNQIGTYGVQYRVSDHSGNTVEKTIAVHVAAKLIDQPTLTVVKDTTIAGGTTFDPFEYVSAQDGEGKDITGNITIVENTVDMFEAGAYHVTYLINDDYGNQTKQTVNFKVLGKGHYPKLEATVNHIGLGQTFDALAYVSANDEEDGNLTSSVKVIKNNIDSMHRGFYDVTYQVTDSDGNTSTLTISVYVG